MSEDSMLMCLIAFVLGYLVGRMMRGNGLRVGGQDERKNCPSYCLDNIMENKKSIKILDTKVKEKINTLREDMKTNKMNIIALNTPVTLSD